MLFDCCYKCPKRWVDPESGTRCHSTCGDYLRECEKNQIYNENYRRENMLALFHEAGDITRVIATNDRPKRKVTSKKSLYSRYR